MVISFVVGFATGPGSIPWFFVTELFQQSARGMATAIAVVVNWTANFLVGLGFEPLKVRINMRMSIYSYTFKSVILESVILESVKIKIFSKSVKMIQIIISENI